MSRVRAEMVVEEVHHEEGTPLCAPVDLLSQLCWKRMPRVLEAEVLLQKALDNLDQ